MPGIWTSISTISKSFTIQGSQCCPAVAHNRYLVSPLFQQASRQSLIHHVVLGHQHSRCDCLAVAEIFRSRGISPRSCGICWRLLQIRSKSSDWRTGLTKYAEIPSFRQSMASPNWSADVSIMIGGPHQLRMVLNLLRQCEAIDFRHLPVQKNQREGPAGVLGGLQRHAARRGRLPPPWASFPIASTIPDRTCRFVKLSSTISTGRSRSSVG